MRYDVIIFVSVNLVKIHLYNYQQSVVLQYSQQDADRKTFIKVQRPNRC